MSQDVETKKKHLSAIEAFIASSGHEAYKAACRHEVQQNKDAQVALGLYSLEDFVELIKLKGELRVLEQQETKFEVARDTLSARIDEMVEAELQNAETTRV